MNKWIALRIIVLPSVIFLLSAGCSDRNSQEDSIFSTQSRPTQSQSTPTMPESTEILNSTEETSIIPQDVQLSVAAIVEDGIISIEIQTNLPDDLEIMVTIEGADGIMGQDTGSINSGNILLGPFTRKGEPYPPGDYQLRVSSPLLELQPSEVQLALGENGEQFRGENFVDGRIDYESSFIVSGNEEESEHLNNQELILMEEHLTYLLEKLESLTSKGENTASSLEWGSWSRDWNIDLANQRELFVQEFGQNLNEYTGNCRDAFFNISVGYGDIFILWQDYDNLITGDGLESDVISRNTYLLAWLNEAQDYISQCKDN